MKQVLLAIFIISMAACNNNAPSKPGKGNDTTKTIVHFIFNANTNDFRTSAAVRFAIDSVQVRPDSTDKSRNITTRVIDTLYNIAAFQKIVDSAGAVVKAKSGVDSVKLVWLGYEKKWILHDYNINYEDYLPKPDSTKK